MTTPAVITTQTQTSGQLLTKTMTNNLDLVHHLHNVTPEQHRAMVIYVSDLPRTIDHPVTHALCDLMWAEVKVQDIYGEDAVHEHRYVMVDVTYQTDNNGDTIVITKTFSSVEM